MADESKKWNECIGSIYDDSELMEKTADCSILVGGEKFKAHRCILSAHSPIFREMFTSPASLEAESGVVAETSIPNPAAFQEFLRYCYKGESMAPWHGEYADDVGVAVFQLADKYCVTSLKAKTEKFLVDGLSSGNVLERIVLADSHVADILKQACINFIANDGSVTKSTGWAELQRERPGLVAELHDGAMDILRRKLDRTSISWRRELDKERKRLCTPVGGHHSSSFATHRGETQQHHGHPTTRIGRGGGGGAFLQTWHQNGQ
jgi:hypothetical protein